MDRDLHKKNLIAVLAGDIYRKSGVWKTNDAEGPGDEKGGPTYDRFRVVAGACLAAEDPEALVLATGGTSPRPEAPTIASVIRRELIELGVAPERILVEEGKLTTYAELLDFQGRMKAGTIGGLFIVSNEWHTPRIAAMIMFAPNLERLRAYSYHIVSAEEVLLRHNAKRWASVVAFERSDPRMRQRLMLEKQGVAQIKNGTYQFT